MNACGLHPCWQWDKEGGEGGDGSVVHHSVRTCCRHQATSQICVWNTRSIRMGSTIKGTREEERERGVNKKNASKRVTNGREGCLYVWVLSHTDNHSAGCQAISIHRDSKLSESLWGYRHFCKWTKPDAADTVRAISKNDLLSSIYRSQICLDSWNV